ncbi:hypothetical protein N7465_010575 [Penicillium sp. CMV-2018d]|nr:hypothetical protein N7465_010575 [Penicillium sp. CMV-2018d]
MNQPTELTEEGKRLDDEKDKKDEEANKHDPQALFDIYVYDDNSGKAKMEKFVTVGSFTNVRGKNLSDIRGMLNNEKALSVRLQGSSFCNKIGAVANESLPFTEYLKSLDRGGTKIEDKSEQKSKKQGYSIQVPTGEEPVTEPQVYAVYFKSRSLTSEMNDVTKDFLKEKLDLELRKSEISAIDKSDLLTSSYSHSNFMAGVKAFASHPTDMTQGQWNTVMDTNSLLHGSYVRLPLHGIAKKVERAMYPAFKLRPRQFHDFNASLDNKDIVIPMKNLMIPRYRVEDDSYVAVSENKSSVAWAIASSSLSEAAAEVAVGGGFYGYSAGAQAGFKNEEQSSGSQARTEDTKHMTITYNFPRVVLQLDEESLQPSDECAEALKHIKDKASVQAFKAKYGTFFATRIELGGRLHATEDSAALGTTSVSEKSKAMKVAASLSFSSPYVQASASASYGSSSANKNESSKGSLDVSMTWEAKGGDTLLCNKYVAPCIDEAGRADDYESPPAWCPTVASFYNWRVVKQENLLSIEDLISRIPGYENTKEVFENAQNGERKEPVLNEGTVPVRFKEKATGYYLSIVEKPSDFLLTLINSQREYWRDGEFHRRLQNTPAVLQWKKQIGNSRREICLVRKGDHTVFNVHGMLATTESKGRVLAGGKYTVCSDMDNTYLQGTTMIPEYQRSLLYGGAKETAWAFTIKPVDPLRQTGTILAPEDDFHIEIGDDKGQLGLMSSFAFNIWTLGVVDGTKESTFVLEYA